MLFRSELVAGTPLVLHELTPMRATLEDAFMELTRDAVEYRSGPDAVEYRSGGDAGVLATTGQEGDR